MNEQVKKQTNGWLVGQNGWMEGTCGCVCVVCVCTHICVERERKFGLIGDRQGKVSEEREKMDQEGQWRSYSGL